MAGTDETQGPEHAASLSLNQKLAKALPAGVELSTYHISTSPTRCDSIFSAPPGGTPDRTRCENHFLAVTLPSQTRIDHSDDETRPHDELLVYAVEVLVYTTKTLTTLFVSKADSTGCLKSSRLPPNTASPLKTISTVFVSHLVEIHRRPGVRLVVSLFARAQDQYLFPGSSENSHKHILDDRKLIRWWCRVLDPIVRHNGAGATPSSVRSVESPTRATPQAQAYLLVPGLDKYQTQALLPPSSKLDNADNKKWLLSDPLRQISSCPAPVPPRCLIPHFPDDPKARYLDELDGELSEASKPAGPAKGAKVVAAGHWRSVRSLEQFWESMEFRQECSSGRAVGFIWIVVPRLSRTETESARASKMAGEAPVDNTTEHPSASLPTPIASQEADLQSRASKRPALSTSRSHPSTSPSKPLNESRRHRSPHSLFSGPILPLELHRRRYRKRRASSSSSLSSNSNGFRVLQSVYIRALELLLRLDFSTEANVAGGTRRWTTEVGAAIPDSAQKADWGVVVTGVSNSSSSGTSQTDQTHDGVQSGHGMSQTEPADRTNSSGAVNVLSTSSIRKKKRTLDDHSDPAKDKAPTEAESVGSQETVVKPAGNATAESVSHTDPTERTIPEPPHTNGPAVNVLGSGLIRKKKKAL